MDRKGISRRGFVGQTLRLAGATAAAGLAQSCRSVPSSLARPALGRHAVRLGGPVSAGGNDPEAIALAHRQLGYRAAYCPAVKLGESDRIRAIREAFARHDVVIAEVGRWGNMMDADPNARATNIKSVTEGLALADELGARCCVDIAGSYNKKYWFGPDPKNFSQEFFDRAVENARAIIDAVKPKRAKLCYEMMGWAYPDSADSYLKMIKAIGREGFGVHLDPCNAICSPALFYRNTDLLNELFDKLGKWIVSCHAKDLRWEVEMNVHFIEVVPGTGVLDYKTYLRRLAELPHDAPLMMEHMKGEEFDQAREYIMATGKGIGIQF